MGEKQGFDERVCSGYLHKNFSRQPPPSQIAEEMIDIDRNDPAGKKRVTRKNDRNYEKVKCNEWLGYVHRVMMDMDKEAWKHSERVNRYGIQKKRKGGGGRGEEGGGVLCRLQLILVRVNDKYSSNMRSACDCMGSMRGGARLWERKRWGDGAEEGGNTVAGRKEWRAGLFGLEPRATFSTTHDRAHKCEETVGVFGRRHRADLVLYIYMPPNEKQKKNAREGCVR